MVRNECTTAILSAEMPSTAVSSPSRGTIRVFLLAIPIQMHGARPEPEALPRGGRYAAFNDPDGNG
jgi:hypothetical protein